MSYIDQDLPHVVNIEAQPCVKPHSGYRYTTCSDMMVDIDGNRFVVPQGFDTDFASIPQKFWSVIAPYESRLVAPSIMHDYMYNCPGDHTRKYADEVFYSALIAQGVSAYDASKFYYAVRFFGEPFYKSGHDCSAIVNKTASS